MKITNRANFTEWQCKVNQDIITFTVYTDNVKGMLERFMTECGDGIFNNDNMESGGYGSHFTFFDNTTPDPDFLE